ncbi:hypothetical protein G6F37_013528 [Rhizopus arrhizus]|nr:hypothetical protein G6F37_013528 [Rhizopus arrhizus]
MNNKYYGNKNFPQKASTSKPCRYCGRSWSHGHHCQEYADYKRKLHVDPKNPRDSDKSIYAIVRTANEENDNDHDMTEAENHSYDFVNFNETMTQEFDVSIGTDVLEKMNIDLTGVAYKYPGNEDDYSNRLKEDAQFLNMNFDANNEIEPNNS